MRIRKDIEDLEEEILAPFAMKSKDSAGRHYDEPDHDVRTCYQRDRDRIVHCEAFRKLEYKTQVFFILEGDYYRTRLTHTIEVAQIARTIGRSLQLNEDLIEAVALAHDLGHPPFGHAGEAVLDDIMETVGLKFNHNQHSFDIVSKFEKRYPDFNGLNLSKEVLVGILKHSTVYDKPGDEHYNVFVDEPPVLEAKIVDIADSLAYLTHDIDDGLTSGYILAEDLNENELWREAYKRLDPSLEQNDRRIFKYQIVKALLDIQIKDFLLTSDKRLKELDFKSANEARDSKETSLGFSPQMQSQRDHLQKMLNEKLYQHYRVLRMTEKAYRIITDLFEVYEKKPEQLSYAIYQRDIAHDKQEKYKIICNYIASMTDRSALDEHKRLFDPYQKV